MGGGLGVLVCPDGFRWDWMGLGAAGGVWWGGEWKRGCRELGGDGEAGGVQGGGWGCSPHPHSSLRVLQSIHLPSRGDGVFLFGGFGNSTLLLWRVSPNPTPSPRRPPLWHSPRALIV